MINNYNKINNLLEFRSEDDFYFLQVIQRKKDHDDRKVNGTNNNSRLIKPYYVRSKEYLEFVMPEIIQLCEIFGARAGIDLNRRSFKMMSMKVIKNILSNMENNEHNKVYKAYSSVCGKHISETEKKWILDYDNIDGEPLSYKHYKLIKEALAEIQPVGNKVIETIPSKNGVHIITSPFNTQQADNLLKSYKIDVHKKNPTNLYIP